MEQRSRSRIRLVISLLGALALGAFIGSVTTIVNQNVLTLAGVPIPYGIILGLLCIAGFLIGLRFLVENRWLSVCGGIGVLGMTFVLSQQSAGGSVLVPNNIYGMVWAIGSSVVTLLVLAWPHIPAKVK